MGIRPFADTLNQLRRGMTADELSMKFAHLVQQVGETGKAGVLTLQLKVTPSKGGALEVEDKITLKSPEAERGATLMFATPEGNLQRNDPRQAEIEGLRSVDRETGELRRVGA